MRKKITLDYISESQKIISNSFYLTNNPEAREVIIATYKTFEKLKKYAS